MRRHQSRRHSRTEPARAEPRQVPASCYGRGVTQASAPPTLEAAGALSGRFGLETFRAGQAAVIERCSRGGALAVFRQGRARPLLPAPCAVAGRGHGRRPPLIALMKGSDRRLDALGVPAARLDSTLSLGGAGRLGATAPRGLRLLYVAPERRNKALVAQLAARRDRAFAVDRRTASRSGATTSGPTTSLAVVRASWEPSQAGTDGDRDACRRRRHLRGASASARRCRHAGVYRPNLRW